MSRTLLAPVSLDSAIALMAHSGRRLPHLERLLASAKITPNDSSLERWVCAQLGAAVTGEPPIAALRLAAEPAPAPDPRSGWWLCADPVMTTLGIDSVRIDGVAAQFTPAEAARVIGDLNATLGPDGLEFFAPHPARWYVRADRTQRVETTALRRAIGRSMLQALPQGADGPAWRTRLNATQMLLHDHRANAAAGIEGRAPAASLWWWGGGNWPAFGPAGVDAVRGGPAWVGAGCAANGIAFTAAAGDPAAPDSGVSRTLHILADEWETAASPEDLFAAWDEQWFAPLAAALGAGTNPGATLVFAWGDGFVECAVAPAAAEASWRRWLGIGRKPVAAPPLGATLETLR